MNRKNSVSLPSRVLSNVVAAAFCYQVLLYFTNKRFKYNSRLQKIKTELSDDFLSRFQTKSYHEAEFEQSVIAPPSLRHNRGFISHIPVEVGDGLGHRFAMLNYEMAMSAMLGVGYVHRRSTYGSLTPEEDPLAVDRLFGFHTYTPHREQVLNQSCTKLKIFKDECNAKTLACLALKNRASGGLYDRLVYLPGILSQCLLGENKTSCFEPIRSFAQKYPWNNTLFAVSPARCQADFRSADWTFTRSFLRQRFWKYAETPTYSPAAVHIAVHVRRGDFFSYKQREMIPDAVYADAVCRIKHALDHEVGAEVHTIVHIYSEGLTKLRSKHDVDEQHKVYMTENGQVAWNGHWTALLAGKCHRPPHIKLHIATNTISAIRDMTAADFFIGSRSGLSAQIVHTLSRGIRIHPKGENAPIRGGIHNGALAFGWSGKGKEAVIHLQQLEKQVSEFVLSYKYKLPLLRQL